MDALTIMLEEPRQVRLARQAIRLPGDADILVDVHFSGVSTGTERLLYEGRMPNFPGMSYPLVPGYEAVGEVIQAGRDAPFAEGDWVFVPGGNCYSDAAALFGGASERITSAGARAAKVPRALGEKGALLALAATAMHALNSQPDAMPDLVVGHGVLGRLMARLIVACGAKAPTVWEASEGRRSGAVGYEVTTEQDDRRTDYKRICDVSGDPLILDTLVGRIERRGAITLAGFYDKPLSILFAPAFQREARFNIAAEWSPEDLQQVSRMISDGSLSLDGLITHRETATSAETAYERAFGDQSCLKMIIDWRSPASQTPPQEHACE